MKIILWPAGPMKGDWQMVTDNKLIEIKHLKKYFHVGKNKTLHAVDDVSFSIDRGQMWEKYSRHGGNAAAEPYFRRIDV